MSESYKCNIEPIDSDYKIEIDKDYTEDCLFGLPSDSKIDFELNRANIVLCG